MDKVLKYKMKLSIELIIGIIVFSAILFYDMPLKTIETSIWNFLLLFFYILVLFVWTHQNNNGLMISSEAIEINNYLRFWKKKYVFKKDEISYICIQDGTTMYYGAIMMTICKTNGEKKNFRFANLYKDNKFNEIKTFLIDKNYHIAPSAYMFWKYFKWPWS